MGELGALFNPGMRHEIEERQSKASRREEEGQADPGNLRIDLLSGVAVINMGGQPDSAATADKAGADVDTDAAVDQAEKTADGTEPAGTEATAVAEEELDDDPSEEDHLVSGSAPEIDGSVDATADSAIDEVALKIAEDGSNDEAAT